MSRDAERAVIGAVLLDPNVLRQAIEVVAPDDFADVTLGRMYAVLVAMRMTGEPIDAQTVAARLARERPPITVTPAQLFALIEQTPTASNVRHYGRIVAEQGAKRRLGTLGLRLQQLADSGDPLDVVMTEARAAWDIARGSASGTIEAKPLGAVLDGPDDYDWAIPNLVEREELVMVTGGEGIGKSYLAQQIAVLSAAGIHPTTFAPMPPLRVTVVDAENREKQWRRRIRPLVRRAAYVGSADPRETMYLANVKRLDLTSQRDVGAIHRLLDEQRPELLFLGPLYRLMPKAIQDDSDAAGLIATIDGFRQNCVVLIEAHAGHATNAAGDRDLRPRGSSALMGWPDFGFGLQLNREDETGNTANLVRWRGDREQRIWPRTLRRGGIWPWTDADPEATELAYQEAIMARG